jgi:hypothetical protein
MGAEIVILMEVSSGHGPPFSNLYKEAVILKSEMVLVVYIPPPL